MDELRELEEELERCQQILNGTNRRNSSTLDHRDNDHTHQIHRNNLYRDTPLDDAQRREVSGESRPLKSLNLNLLASLENAPEGPFELDPNLLYSPRSSISHHDAEITSPIPHRLDSLDDAHKTVNQQQLPFSVEAAVLDDSKQHPSRRRALERIRELRKELQEKEMAECTFIPRTGRPPTGPKAQLSSSLPVQDRLLLQASKRREERLQRLREEKEEAEKAECTFAPRLPKNSSTNHLEHFKPIHQRLGELWRKKQEMLENARLKADKNVSFKPQLNPRSRYLAANSNRRTEPSSLPKRVDREEKEGACQKIDFKPRINPISCRIVEQSDHIPAKFLQRQKHFERAREANKQKLFDDCMRTGGDGRACTFQPCTNDMSLAMLALSDTRYNQIWEAPEEKWQRLAVTEARMRQQRLKEKEMKMREEESAFVPRLNPNSLAIAAQKRMRDGTRMFPPNPHRPKEKCTTTAMTTAERELQQCTFCPDISKTPVMGYYDEYQPPEPHAKLSIAAAQGDLSILSQQIEEHARAKEEWAAEMRKKEEEKILADCTFAPNLTKPTIKCDFSVDQQVRGIDGYLSKVAMAEKKHADAATRAAKVFLLHPKSNRGPTVVKPFTLASELRAAHKRNGAKK